MQQYNWLKHQPSDGLPFARSSSTSNDAMALDVLVAQSTTMGAMSSHCTVKSLAVGQHLENSLWYWSVYTDKKIIWSTWHSAEI